MKERRRKHGPENLEETHNTKGDVLILQAWYNLTGPNLVNNQSVREAVLTAMGNTLGRQDASGVQLQSFTGAAGGGEPIILP